MTSTKDQTTQQNAETEFSVPGDGSDTLLDDMDAATQLFEDKNTGNLILSVTCQAAASGNDLRVRLNALKRLAKIADNFIEFLPAQQTILLEITESIIHSVDAGDDLVLAVIELWSSIAETEVSVRDETDGETLSSSLVNTNLEILVKLMLEVMVRQKSEEPVEKVETEWNPSVAASSCLQLFVEAAGGESVQPLVMPFVQQNISNYDWHYREAAVCAYAILLQALETADPTVISKIMELTKDPITLVRDTAVFAIGRFGECQGEMLVGDKKLLQAVGATVMKALEDPCVPVVDKACWAVHTIAENIVDKYDDEYSESNELSPYFEPLMQKMLAVLDRADTTHSSELTANAYTAFSTLVNSAANGKAQYLESTVLPVVIARLSKAIEAKPAVNDILGGLCYALQGIVKKIDIDDFSVIMDLFIRVIEMKPRNSSAEDALLAVSAVVVKQGTEFQQFMPQFVPCLLGAFMDRETEHGFTAAVSLLGDITRALDRDDLLMYANPIMTALIQGLHDPAVSRTVKPIIIANIGDVALALGRQFEPYAKVFTQILVQAAAAGMQLEIQHEEDEDYRGDLLRSVFEAYTGMIQGYRQDGKQNMFEPFIDDLITLIASIAAQEPELRDDKAQQAAVAVIGDLAHSYGQKVKSKLKTREIMALIEDAVQGDEGDNGSARWAQKQVKML